MNPSLAYGMCNKTARAALNEIKIELFPHFRVIYFPAEIIAKLEEEERG